MEPAVQITIDGEGIAHFVFDQPGERLNTLSAAILSQIEKALEEIASREDVTAMLLTSAKKDCFIAGADLKSFRPVFDEPSRADKLLSQGHRVLNKLADLPFPTVALIDGVCLGGGLEFALACQYRIVTDSPSTSLGLPEVMLGLMPGWGGTQRLPRLVGLEQALGMIVSGKRLDGKRAFKIGVADAIVNAAFVEEQVPSFMAKILSKKGPKRIVRARKKHCFRRLLLERNPLGRKLVFSTTRKRVLEKTQGHYPAPLAAIETIEETYGLPLDIGLEREKQKFLEYIPTAFVHAHHLIGLFFAQESLKKAVWVPPDIEPRPIKSVGVVGAGTMGKGIIWQCSYKGLPVRFQEVNQAAMARGYQETRKIYDNFVKKVRRLKPWEANLRYHLISGTTNYTGFQGTDLVVEAATEEIEAKRKILSDIESSVSADTIIGTNTSSMAIADLAQQMRHPERFVGLHFFNPANRMPLVEVVPGPQTSPETVATAVAFCRKLNKTPIVVGDGPGFLVNRVYMAGGMEPVRLLQEGVDMERLEKVFTDFGMPMGPFTLSDTIGIDVGYKVMRAFEAAYGERMRVPKLLRAMFEEQLWGVKVGKGYFIYSGKSKKRNRRVRRLVNKIGRGKISITDEGILDRILLPTINEAARCLDEGIVTDPAHIDMALILGTGFPPFRGGLLRYADDLGAHYVVSHLKALEETYGTRYAPCEYLVRMVDQKASFYT